MGPIYVQLERFLHYECDMYLRVCSLHLRYLPSLKFMYLHINHSHLLVELPMRGAMTQYE